MNEQPPLAMRVTQAVPPIAPGALPARPTTWPMPVGIIAIIFGAMAILAYLGCGVPGQIMQGFSAGILKATGQSNAMVEAQMTLQRKYFLFSLSSNVLLGSLGILLLVCGIGLIRRRPWVRRGILVWAIARIVVAVPVAWISFIIAQETMRIMTETAANDSTIGGAGNPGIGFASGFMKILGPVGIIASVLWAWLLPVFVLVWFLVPRIRNEVRSWRGVQSI